VKPNSDKKAILLELIEKGKQKGMLTYQEIMDAFEELISIRNRSKKFMRH